MKRGPDHKTSGWRTGAWFVGWALILIFLRFWDIVGFTPIDAGYRWILLFTILGGLLTLGYGFHWLKNGDPEPKGEPMFQALPKKDEDGKGYMVVKMKSPDASSLISMPPPKVGIVGYVLYWGAIRLPMELGDLVLSYVWGIRPEQLRRARGGARRGGEDQFGPDAGAYEDSF